MRDQRYRDVLLEEIENLDVEEDLEDDSNAFLTWVTAQVLLGREPDPDRQRLAEQRKRAPVTKNTRGDVIDWAALAAAAVLLGEDWRADAERSLERLDAALESYGDSDRILEPAVGLAMLRGDRGAIADWRARRLALPLSHDAEALGFELLYLSSGHLGEVPLESLALAVSLLVATRIVGGSPLNSAAPMVCALARLALDHGQEITTLLQGRVEALDLLTFGPTGTRPQLKARPPAFDLRRSNADEAIAEIRVEVNGSGTLSSGAHAIEAFGARLLPVINALKDRVEQPAGDDSEERAIFEDALFAEGGRLRCVLRLGREVELPQGELAGFRGRFAVAWEHAQRRDRRLRSTASLEVEGE